MALPERTHVAVIGAGFSGLCMAARLLENGIEDFVVVERASEVGGTWRDNTYPGCQCDIPSALYSLSFAPNPDWTRLYPRQEEIRAYLQGVARDFGINPHIVFDTAVEGAEWDEQSSVWRIATTGGTLTANVMVAGMGGLTEPSIPDIPGIDRFQGTMFHSSRWDHDHDLAGERVGVIGTGASSVQFVPEIQPDVAELKLFQRTPSWVLPDADRKLTRIEKRLFKAFPITQRAVRAGLYLMHEATVFGTIVDRRLSKGLEMLGRRNLKSQVPDPELRAKLTPDYTIGCKRITMSNTYLRSLTQPNAELVTDSIREIREHSIVTADGTERELDTIILGTGFKVFDQPGYETLRGRDGQTLDDVWNGSPRAYLGTAVKGFPNLFLIVGPNSAGGYNSILFTTESHVNYAIEAIKTMDRNGIANVEVKPGVYEEFNRRTDETLNGSVWNDGGCSSWYLDGNGRNGIWWPGFTWRLWQRTRRFDLGHYEAIVSREAARVLP